MTEDGTKLDKWFGVRWFWIVVLWCATEYQAIRNKNEGDTFTAFVRRFFSLEYQGKWWLARRLAAVCFLAWLVWHFMGGIITWLFSSL